MNCDRPSTVEKDALVTGLTKSYPIEDGCTSFNLLHHRPSGRQRRCDTELLKE